MSGIIFHAESAIHEIYNSFWEMHENHETKKTEILAKI